MPNRQNDDIYSAYKQFEFDELNTLYYKLLEAVSEQGEIIPQDIIEECEDFLIEMYFAGMLSIEQMTDSNVIMPNRNEVINTVYNKIDGKDFADRINTACGMDFHNAAERLEKIFVSDGHRCFVSGQFYGANQINGTKIWDATMDERTRPTHADLHGTELMIEEYFETINGKALAPGMFGVAEEDVNCRCLLKIGS